MTNPATPNATPKPIKLIPIAATTDWKVCGCGETIYMAPHPSSGKRHPFSITVEGGLAPTGTTPGLGVSHFTNCPKVQDYGRKSPGR